MNRIIVVDSDIAFVHRLNTKLAEEEIVDKYEFHLLCPDTTLGKPQLIEHCLRAVNQLMFGEYTVIGIFVDIVIIEGGKKLDITGIDIASALKRNYPNLPIFNITGKYSDDESDTDIISAATLENSDGVLIKSYLEGKYFSAKRLRNIFEKAKLRRTDRGEVSLHESQVHRLPEAVKNAYNVESLDPRVEAQINQIGATEFWSLLMKMLPDGKGTVSFMRPGRSGAFMFKVNAKFVTEGEPATRPKLWAVKVSGEAGQIERELKNYSEMTKTPLPRAFYPKTFGESVTKVGNLAGFALELEDGTSSLLKAFAEYPKKALGPLIGSIDQFIKDTYGDSQKKIGKLWREFYELNEGSYLRIGATLEENKALFRGLDEVKYETVATFVRTKGLQNESIMNYEAELDVRTVHGDFNAGNLLVNRDLQLFIIDFAARGKGHVATDIAKLERDVVFKIYDSGSKNYYEWARIAHWREFLSLVQKGQVFSQGAPKTKSGSELEKCFSFISGIRQNLKKEAPQLSEKEYLLALLHYALLAIAHPEISIQKKTFAVEYVSEILNCIN